MSTRWIVGPSDGATLSEALGRRGDRVRGADADGRAFINGRRGAPGDAVRPGDTIEVWEPRGPAPEAVRLLVRARGLVIADKPVSLPTTPDRRGDRSLITEVASLAGAEDRRRLDVRHVHAASRLDVGVSGVVLCAIGEQAQRHVVAMRAAGKIHRVYAAIAAGAIQGEGTWDAPIGRVSSGGRLKPSVSAQHGEPAETRYRALAHAKGPRGPSTLLRSEPITGRTHQIRVHASAAGAPLYGDREHGGPSTAVDGKGRVLALGRISLHAALVEVPGEDGKLLRAASPIPEELRALWEALGGDPAAWAAFS